MAKENKTKIVTKKHLARMERERIQKRYILIATLAAVVISVGALFYAVVKVYLIDPNRPVAVVNGEKITIGEFQTRVRYYRQNLVSQYSQGYQVYQMFAQSDPSTAEYFTSQLTQISAQLNNSSTLGQQVLDGMIDEELIRQEAERQGITVSDEEIEKYIQTNFQYFPDGTPTPVPTDLPTPIPATLSATQLAMVTATPTITPTMTATPVLTPTEVITPTATATFTPVPEVTPTGEPTPTASPTPYTKELFEQEYQNFLDGIRSGANVGERDIIEVVRAQLLSEKLTENMFGGQPKEQDQVWIRQIVGTTQEIAQQAYDRVQAGEDFGAVAAELSADASSVRGGDMSWVTLDSLATAVADAASGMKIGDISAPIETPSGWVVFQLVDKRVWTLSQAELDQAEQTKFSEWLTTQRTSATESGSLTINDDVWTVNVPSRPSIPAGMEITTTQQ